MTCIYKEAKMPKYVIFFLVQNMTKAALESVYYWYIIGTSTFNRNPCAMWKIEKLYCEQLQLQVILLLRLLL